MYQLLTFTFSFLAVYMNALLPAYSGTTPDGKFMAFDLFIEEQLKANSVAGVSVALIEQSVITHEIALGTQSTSSNEAMTIDTVFQAASISKAVTAWGIMHLVQEGKLNLDAPISTYLTRWHLPPSSFNSDDVTIRRVLSHTGGLSLPSYVGFEPNATLPDFEHSLSGDTNGSGTLELVAEPGNAWAYSGGGYTLLGLIIEEVSGLSFADYMQTEIFSPLGMTDSSYLPNDDLLARTAEAHDFHLNTIPNYRLAAQGAGSLHTTARDLARFAIANMADNPVLTRETLTLMHRPVIKTGFGSEMGLGFFIESEGQLIGHNGSNRGWKTRVQFRPATGDGLVLLTNSESGEALIDSAFCYWNDTFQIGLLTTSCAIKQEQKRALRLIGWAITAVLAAIITLMTYRLITSISRGKRRLKSPRPGTGRGMVILGLAILFAAHYVFMQTGYGVWLVAGIPWGFSIADHAPAPIRHASTSLLAFYLVSALFMLTPRTGN